MNRYDYLFKVILLGDVSSGKSSIFTRLIYKTFENTNYYRMVDLGIFNCEVDNLKVRIQMWDTAGQSRFREIPVAYYRNVDAVIFVFDVCQRQTLLNIDRWLVAASKHSPESAVRILVGNKIDMKIEREVEEEEGRVFAEERNMPYFETSAKDGINIEEMFLLLAEEMKRVRDGSKPYSNTFGSVPIQPTNYQSTCW